MLDPATSISSNPKSPTGTTVVIPSSPCIIFRFQAASLDIILNSPTQTIAVPPLEDRPSLDLTALSHLPCARTPRKERGPSRSGSSLYRIFPKAREFLQALFFGREVPILGIPDDTSTDSIYLG